MHIHMVYNVPVLCIANRVGNQLGAWQSNDSIVEDLFCIILSRTMFCHFRTIFILIIVKQMSRNAKETV